MTWSLGAGLVAALVGAASGWFVPRLIARIPEPEEAEHKEPYAAIAARPGLAWKCATASALVAGSLGARVGWQPELVFLLVLATVGVALSVIDWRTRLLPTKLIAPTYVVVVPLVVLAAALGGEWQTLLRAGLAWLAGFAVFFALWFIYPAGLGYGDVRLSGLLGIALGWFGWDALLAGLYTGVLLGTVFGGALTAARRLTRKSHYPMGPFLLIGTWLTVAFTPYVVGVYAWLLGGLTGLVAAGLNLVG